MSVTYVLIIVMYGSQFVSSGATNPVAMTQVAGFRSNNACVQQAMAIRKRPYVRDTFCVAVK